MRLRTRVPSSISGRTQAGAAMREIRTAQRLNEAWNRARLWQRKPYRTRPASHKPGNCGPNTAPCNPTRARFGSAAEIRNAGDRICVRPNLPIAGPASFLRRRRLTSGNLNDSGRAAHPSAFGRQRLGHARSKCDAAWCAALRARSLAEISPLRKFFDRGNEHPRMGRNLQRRWIRRAPRAQPERPASGLRHRLYPRVESPRRLR